MPRFNVKHEDRYYVFSTIVDNFIHEFDTFEELQQWRLEEYGRAGFDNEPNFESLNANKMTWDECMNSLRKEQSNV